MKEGKQKRERYCTRCGMLGFTSYRGICNECQAIARKKGQQITSLKLILRLGGKHGTN